MKQAGMSQLFVYIFENDNCLFTVFVDGDFKDICSLLEKPPGHDLNEQISVLFKKIDKIENSDESSDQNTEYSVMNDSEPYMKFCPEIFMYY